MLLGEGEYNLNAWKLTKVTDSYLGLDQDVRGCQQFENIVECQTKYKKKYLLQECGCLPSYHMAVEMKVRVFL